MKSYFFAFILLASTSVSAGDDEDVKIGVKCGTLKGTGAILIADPKTQKIYTLPFTCGGVAT